MSADRAGLAALALDALLCSPDLAEIEREFRARASTAMLDQSDAAAAQVFDGMRRVVASGWATPLAAADDPSDHPGWVRLGALTALTTWWAGEGSTCMHSPVIDRPEPVGAAAWRPGLVACGRCTHLFLITNKTKDATCDGCGRVTTGPENGDGIRPNLVVVGYLTWMFGTCTDCDYTPKEKGA